MLLFCLVIAFAAIAVPSSSPWRNGKPYNGMRIGAVKATGQDERSSWGPERWDGVFTRPCPLSKFGLDPVAFVDDDPQRCGLEIYQSSYHHTRSAKVMAGPVSPDLLRRLNASVLVIATFDATAIRSCPLPAELSAAGVNTYFVPRIFPNEATGLTMPRLTESMLAHLSKARTGFIYEPGKRALDVAGAVLCLALFAIPLCVIAALVKLTSPGPVLVGNSGRERWPLFPIYKFRTMFRDAPTYAYSPKHGNDPHITPIWPSLRKTSLDELPQLLNVVLGVHVAGRPAAGNAFYRRAIHSAAASASIGEAWNHRLVATECGPRITDSPKYRIRSVLHPKSQSIDRRCHSAADLSLRRARSRGEILKSVQ